tara:strand:+ start:11540 stop:12232 length:693 start_codon:yes stop_codon:yes gene_type:complete
MSLHSAYGLPLEELDLVAIDDSKAMQGIYRSIFSTLRTKRARVYGDPERAMNAMLNEPPNVLLLDWRMDATSGAKLLRTLRLKQMDPLCFLPVIVVSAYGSQSVVELAYRLGASSFLLKPISPDSLVKRLQWIAGDVRELRLENDRYVIEGVDLKLEQHREKAESLSRARAYHDEKQRSARKDKEDADSDELAEASSNQKSADEKPDRRKSPKPTSVPAQPGSFARVSRR